MQIKFCQDENVLTVCLPTCKVKESRKRCLFYTTNCFWRWWNFEGWTWCKLSTNAPSSKDPLRQLKTHVKENWISVLRQNGPSSPYKLILMQKDEKKMKKIFYSHYKFLIKFWKPCKILKLRCKKVDSLLKFSVVPCLFPHYTDSLINNICTNPCKLDTKSSVQFSQEFINN